MEDYKRFLKHFFATTAAILALIAAFNVIVDPYGIWGIIDLKGFNGTKNRVQSERMTKFYCVRRFMPENLIMGSSRVLSFEPKAMNRYVKGSTYNLALSGTCIRELYEYLEYIASRHKLGTVVLGIDLFTFNPVRNDLGKNIQVRTELERLRHRFYVKDFLDCALCYDAADKSVQTIRDSISNTSPHFDMYSGTMTWDTYKNELSRKGVSFVRGKIADRLEFFRTTNDLYGEESFRNPDSLKANFGYFVKIVELCRREGIDLRLYVSPVYVSHFELIYRCGLGTTYEALLRAMAQVTGYYDFSGRNSITTNVNYYWDSDHMRSELGRAIFARLFDDKNIRLPENFGVFVNRENVEAHLLKLRKDLAGPGNEKNASKGIVTATSNKKSPQKATIKNEDSANGG
ncbi:MAG: hypothetical protein HQK89_15685 [Nitrospirae bacterium]|nr:hypothetical protein [Nitrospirota bacterium]